MEALDAFITVLESLWFCILDLTYENRGFALVADCFPDAELLTDASGKAMSTEF